MFTYSNGYWEVYRRFQGDFFGWGRVEGGYVGGCFHGGNSHGGQRLSMEGAQDFLALFTKNNEKINMKRFFY